MKFYIAARFDKKVEVNKLYELLKNKGHEITCDWTLHKTIKPYDENQDLAKNYSIEDILGVKDSDVFILLGDKAGTGMYVELGAAIFSNIILNRPKIYIIGEYIARSMFFYHPFVNRRKNVEEVLNELEIN